MIRLGLVGSHNFLYELVPALREKDDFKITGIYDINENSLFSLTDELMIQPVIIPETLLMRSDALMVLGEPADYYDFLIKGLQFSKHIFLPGMGGLSLKQIETLIKMAVEAQVVIYNMRLLRFPDRLNLVQHHVQNPFCIEISCLKRFAIGQNYRENLKEIIMKAAEVLLMINNNSILKIQPKADAIFSEQVDFINTRIDFTNGCIANITAGLFAEEDEFKIKIYQRNGIVEIDVLNDTLNLVIFGKNRSVSAMPLKSENGRGSEKLFGTELKKFCDLILKAECSTTTLEESYNSILLTTKIFEKIQIPVIQEK